MRKKWDDRTKLQLGKLIKNQLDMHVKLNDAVSRAAEIMQAPRSTCMNYWQKELKNLDYSQDPVTLNSKNAPSVPPDHPLPRQSDLILEERENTLASLLHRLRDNEEKVQRLHNQIGMLLSEYTVLMKELAAALEVKKASSTDRTEDLPPKIMKPLTVQELSAGDIVRVHYHIWQDYYYISDIDGPVVYGYKLNKSLRIRRKSKEKLISMDMLQFGKVIRRQVAYDEVKSDDDALRR